MYGAVSFPPEQAMEVGRRLKDMLCEALGVARADELRFTYIDDHREMQGPFQLSQLRKWNRCYPETLPGTYWLQQHETQLWVQLGLLAEAVEAPQAELAGGEEGDEDVVMVDAEECAAFLRQQRASGMLADLLGPARMLDPSSMAVPMAVDLQSPPPPNRYLQVLLVVDTNVLLTRFSVLERLRQEAGPLNQVGEDCEVAVTVVVPWIVLCELDRLKSVSRTSERGGQAVAACARRATRRIQRGLRDGDNFIQSQSMQHFLQAEAAVVGDGHAQSCSSNDDLILRCCMYYHRQLASGATPQRQPRSHKDVALATGDVNLQLKALSAGVTCCNPEQLSAATLRKLQLQRPRSLPSAPSGAALQQHGPPAAAAGFQSSPRALQHLLLDRLLASVSTSAAAPANADADVSRTAVCLVLPQSFTLAYPRHP